MVHIATSALLAPDRFNSPFSENVQNAGHSVMVVRDHEKNNHLLDVICDFFDIGVEHVGSEERLAPLLRECRPIAVIADLESAGQDGYHVMMTVAGHDPSLPILLLTDDDPMLLGAVDAVKEIWGLERVVTISGPAETGKLVDFLCQAARDAGMSRMMRL